MSLVGAMLDLVYPRVCVACGGGVGVDGRHLCWDCMAALHPITEPYCERCGDPMDGVIGHRYTCSTCDRHPPGFEQARSAVRYRGAVRDALRRFKYEHDVSPVADLARLLEACVRTHYGERRFDAVGSVPLYPTRERHRTYNQAQLLAGALTRRLKAPPLTRACLRRVRDTGTQTGLSALQRRANVRQAFRVDDGSWVQGRTILLIDDVMTTGATISEASRMLREAGATGVFVATVARG